MTTYRFYHVTSSLNRDSIRDHGLDSARMAAARGIAGSREPEQEGCFLCRDEDEAEWFISMNNTGGPVDLWAVDGVDLDEMIESPEGYSFVPRRVPSTSVELLRRDIPPHQVRPAPPAHEVDSTRDTSSDPEATKPGLPPGGASRPGLSFELWPE